MQCSLVDCYKCELPSSHSVPEGGVPSEQQRVHPSVAARLRATARGLPGRRRVRGQLRTDDPRAEATLLPQLAEGHSGDDQKALTTRIGDK